MSTHRGPSSSQHANAVAAVAAASTSRPTLEELTARIIQLEARLEELEPQSKGNLQKAKLSPVGNLPAEIMSEIFLLAIETPVLNAAGRHDLENLNLVCRNWREVLLATRRLWSGVSMQSSDIQYDRIVAWLLRSGKLAKTVVFSPPNPPCECHSGKTCYSNSTVLRRLLTEGPTLTHFRLECHSIQCYRAWNTSLASAVAETAQPRPWDQLRSFDLSFSQVDQVQWNEPVDPAQSVFNNLPAASSLRLALPLMVAAFEDPQDAVEASLHIPPNILQNITVLEIRCDWWGTHILDLLQHCAQLESLTIDTSDTSPEDGPTPTDRLEALKQDPIVLPNLRKLRMQSMEHADILKYILTPSLRHLNLHWLRVDDPLPDCTSPNQIFKFIKASNLEGTLESLHLSDLCTLVDYLTLILINLWGLQSLTLERVKVQGAWAMWQGFQLVAKAVQPDEPVRPQFKGRQYLPSLRKLELLEIPEEYRIEWIGLYLKERKDGIPCNLKISYRTQTRQPRRHGNNLLEALYVRGLGVSHLTIL